MTESLRPQSNVAVARRALLLSNGRYTVAINAAGSGFSRWQDLAVTRWREDPTRDAFGSYVLLRDRATWAIWSAGLQPCGHEAGTSRATLTGGRAEIVRQDGTIATTLEIAVARDFDAEVRRVTIANHGDATRDIDVTSYAELVLGSAAADAAHPAFSKMFVQTEWVQQPGVLLATRRRRDPEEPHVWAAHLAVQDAQDAHPPEYETDRARFLGRGRVLRNARAMERGATLSNSDGAVLDPVFGLRRRVRIAPGASVRVAFWTLLADSRDGALAGCAPLVAADACDRVFAGADDHETAERARLGIDAGQAECFQRLVEPLLHADAASRATPSLLERGAGGAPVLWTRGISGDRPIVLIRIGDEACLESVRDLLAAQRYWQSKRFGVDVVVLNTARDAYSDTLQATLETLQSAHRSQLTASPGLVRAEIFAMRDGEITAELRDGLTTVARIVVDASAGGLHNCTRRDIDADVPIGVPEAPAAASAPPAAAVASAAATPAPVRRRRMNVAAPAFPAESGPLEFDNGIGGFSAGGREYAITLADDRCTPAPWINVIANPSFGFLVSAEGGGYAWSLNSQQNPLTPWPNDPVSDSPHDVLYLRDEDSGELWSATALPIRVPGATYTRTHGKGYTRFDPRCARHRAGAAAVRAA